MNTKVFSGDDINSLYTKILASLLNEAHNVTVRGQETLELPLTIVELTNLSRNIVTKSSRRLNPIFMAAEFLWLFSGSNDLAMISYYNKNMSKYSDDGIILRGAYGPRLRDWYGKDQLLLALNKLRQDKSSRQAVLQIFDPAQDYEVSKDIPCNTLLKFQIRENRLNMSVFVRSQDIIYGFPYDLFHWTMLQEIFASMLSVELGCYYHIMDSLHLYCRDIDLALKIACDNNDEINWIRPCICKKIDSYAAFLAELSFLTTLDYKLRRDSSYLTSFFYDTLLLGNSSCIFRDFERLLILNAIRKNKPFNYENYVGIFESLREPFQGMASELWPLKNLRELV
ncbi:thymidylate synthase [Patescibacteria group bacterium]|nr:thymidylate synthase [Patescibacteria group bacterium]